MTIIFKDGVYHVNAECANSIELIKEFSIGINMLAHDNYAKEIYERKCLHESSNGLIIEKQSEEPLIY